MKVTTLLSKLTLMLALGGMAASCSEETPSTLGVDVMPRQDSVLTAQQNFQVVTHTVRTSPAVARTNSSWLGSVVDPETGVRTTNDFVAQFHVPESFRLPAEESMHTDATGQVVADSCVLSIYHGDFYGDSLAVLRVTAREVDTTRTPDERTPYLTDTGAATFVDGSSGEQTSVSYSIFDQTKPQSIVQGNAYYRRVELPLSADYGTRILRAYYRRPAYFANSYEFAHHVCGGFYFRHSGGVGAMLKSDFVAMDLYFRYRSKTKSGADTLVNGTQRLVATDEVIQLPKIDHEFPEHLFSATDAYTYVKAPLALHTEAELPVDAVVAGTHYTDTINSASLQFRTVQGSTEGKSFPRPRQLLLVRAEEGQNFFARHRVPDNVTSYMTAYSSSGTSAGSYTFDNIGPLIAHLRRERDLGAGVTSEDSETVRRAKWHAWEQSHPMWNKVVLLPVSSEYTTTTDIYGNSVRTLVRVYNDFGLSSVRLEGGQNSGVALSVVYSKFRK